LTRHVSFRPEARQELSSAAAWYRSRSISVARAFRTAIRQAIAAISERPDSFAEIGGGVRRALTPPFPYAIFFNETNETVLVLAVKHQAQDPESWPSSV